MNKIHHYYFSCLLFHHNFY